MGGLKFIIVHRIEASPAVVRLLERIAIGGPSTEVTEALKRIEEHMATVRQMLDALKVGVERNEEYRDEIVRLKEERERLALEEEQEDAAELEEDREHAAQVEAWNQERTALSERIAFLEAQTTITDAERDELAELIDRLNNQPPIPTDAEEPPPAPQT
jgi:chromosome segregation ATPase